MNLNLAASARHSSASTTRRGSGLWRAVGHALCLVLALSVGTTSADDRFAFQSEDQNGQPVKVQADQVEATVVCFLGTECPMAKLYSVRLQKLSDTFPEVRFIGVFSNAQDSAQEIQLHSKRHNLSFPLVRDNENRIADQFGAQRTPEVFLLDRDLALSYRGRIDDQYQPGTARPHATRDDLRLAMEQLLSGQPVTVKSTEANGCLIGRVSRQSVAVPKVTFTNQIARILNHHCYQCHREGDIGPMSFDDYDEVVGWADMILEVVEDDRMPPWHADTQHAAFSNERRMTAAEKQMLKDWVAAGKPLGDPQQLPAKPTLKPPTEWRLGQQPDLVIPMRERPFVVPAEGTVDYQYFVVDPKFETDRWIIGAEILPGDRTVLHHSIVFVRPPDGADFQGIGWIAAFVPGQESPVINPSYGRRIPAGSRFVFQQHYTPNGSSTDDLTRLGLVFGDPEKIEHEVFTLLAMNQDFLIPPQAKQHPVEARFRYLPQDGSLLGIAPHMHYRGKSFQLSIQRKDTDNVEPTPETLLNVPHYDFNWQHHYLLRDPISLKDVSSMQFVATFDNSSDNPFNPDPEQHVGWGDQTWEEMAVAFATVARPRQRTPPSGNQPPASPQELAERKAEQEELDKRVQAFVQTFLNRFDTNQDGLVGRNEMTRSMKKFGLWSVDANGDGIIDRDELTDAARWRYRQR